jgi:hypothetical protein
MKRRIVSLITLESFAVFSFSCHSVMSVDPKLLTSESKIQRVEKTSGETIEFNEEHPAALAGNSISGTGFMIKATDSTEVPTTEIDKVEFRTADNFYTIKLRDGKVYSGIVKIESKGEKAVLHMIKPVAQRIDENFKILISDVARAWEMKFNWAKTFLFVLTMAGTVLSIMVFIAAAGLGKAFSNFLSSWGKPLTKK